MRFVAADIDLLRRLDLPPETAPIAAIMAASGAVALIEDDGRVLAAGGLVPITGHRSLAWLIAGPAVERRHWGRIVAFIRARLETDTTLRMEATIATVAGDNKALRFAGALGFRIEGRMRGYDPDGRDHLLVARVRDGFAWDPEHRRWAAAWDDGGARSLLGDRSGGGARSLLGDRSGGGARSLLGPWDEAA